MTKRKRGKRITPAQAAEILEVSRWTVVRWCNEGLLPHERTFGGHIRIREIDAKKHRRQNQCNV